MDQQESLGRCLRKLHGQPSQWDSVGPRGLGPFMLRHPRPHLGWWLQSGGRGWGQAVPASPWVEELVCLFLFITVPSRPSDGPHAAAPIGILVPEMGPSLPQFPHAPQSPPPLRDLGT